MKILHLTASHRWTGAAEPAARLAAAQTKLGVEVLYAMTAGHSFEREATALGVAVTDEVAFQRSYLPHRKLRDLRNLRSLIENVRPDIVHSHLTHDHMLAAVAIGSPGALKPLLVRTYHREASPRRDFLSRWIARRTAGAMTVSEALAVQVREAFTFPEERVVIAGGAVDSVRFAPSDRGAAMRERWGIPAGAPVVGTISRLRVERGIAWLLDAAEDFLSASPTAWLVICGRGNYQEEMKDRIAKHPLRDRIHYAGYVSGSDLEDAYNAFDVALLLRPGNDGACRGALEAMACGRPVIAGDIGALHDLIQGTERGWLVADGDRKGLADVVTRALGDLTETRRRGAIAREAMAREFGEEALAREAIAFYERLLALGR
jgi:glycosyltransferase involved in cell wall biosynthesis